MAKSVDKDFFLQYVVPLAEHVEESRCSDNHVATLTKKLSAALVRAVKAEAKAGGGGGGGGGRGDGGGGGGGRGNGSGRGDGKKGNKAEKKGYK